MGFDKYFTIRYKTQGKEKSEGRDGPARVGRKIENCNQMPNGKRPNATSRRRPDAAQGDNLVFPGRDGVRIIQISDSFGRAVDKLKLNEGVTDRRQRLTFHLLRHSFASWLAMGGVDLYHVKELLGHSDLKLTERYSHLSESVLKAAIMRIQNGQ